MPAREPVGQLLISKRVVRIRAPGWIPWRTSREVQTVRLVPRGKATALYPLWSIMVLLLFAGGLRVATSVALPMIDLRFGVERSVRQGVMIAVILAGVWIAFLVGLIIIRLLRAPLFALIIETAGTPHTVLSGTDRGEVESIEHAVVRAIEDPPPYEIAVPVGPSIHVDARGSRGLQVGSHNTQSNTY